MDGWPTEPGAAIHLVIADSFRFNCVKLGNVEQISTTGTVVHNFGN